MEGKDRLLRLISESYLVGQVIGKKVVYEQADTRFSDMGADDSNFELSGANPT
jgi:hypothetical protein